MFERMDIVVLISDAEPEAVPWPVDEQVPQWSFLPLNGHLSKEQVGLVVRELVLHANVQYQDDPSAMLSNLLTVDMGDLTLPGGVQIVDDSGMVIVPAEGCGVEDWRDWLTYAADEFNVWMGEEPAPFVERTGDRDVIVWSHWTSDPDDPELFSIVIAADAMRPALVKLDNDLRGFRERLAEWALSFGPGEFAEAIRNQFDEAF